MFTFNESIINSTIGPMMKEIFGPMINSTNGLGNKEETHVSRGFSNSLLISIVPIGFILLMSFYLCVYENISKKEVDDRRWF